MQGQIYTVECVDLCPFVKISDKDLYVIICIANS